MDKSNKKKNVKAPAANKVNGKPLEKMLKNELVAKHKVLARDLEDLKKKITTKNKALNTSQRNTRGLRDKLRESEGKLIIANEAIGLLEGERDSLVTINKELKVGNDVWNEVFNIIRETVDHIAEKYGDEDGKLTISSWKFWTWYSIGKYSIRQFNKIVKLIQGK